MSVLTIASSKGGPGKTTLAMLLASTLAADGYSVLLVDADPTEALSRWIKNTYEGPAIQGVAETDETRLAHLIGERADEPDLLLVDTAGFGNRAAAVAMTSSDAILVPALAGEADITEAEKTVRLAEGLARAARRAIPAFIVLNRVRRTQLARHAAQEIMTASLPRLDATLSDLVAYGELSYSGHLPASGPALAEVKVLIAELQAKGHLPRKPKRRTAVTTSFRSTVTP
jgi:chromosome partitioning protein